MSYILSDTRKIFSLLIIGVLSCLTVSCTDHISTTEEVSLKTKVELGDIGVEATIAPTVKSADEDEAYKNAGYNYRIANGDQLAIEVVHGSTPIDQRHSIYIYNETSRMWGFDKDATFFNGDANVALYVEDIDAKNAGVPVYNISLRTYQGKVDAPVSVANQSTLADYRMADFMFCKALLDGAMIKPAKDNGSGVLTTTDASLAHETVDLVVRINKGQGWASDADFHARMSAVSTIAKINSGSAGGGSEGAYKADPIPEAPTTYEFRSHVSIGKMPITGKLFTLHYTKDALDKTMDATYTKPATLRAGHRLTVNLIYDNVAGLTTLGLTVADRQKLSGDLDANPIP